MILNPPMVISNQMQAFKKIALLRVGAAAAGYVPSFTKARTPCVLELMLVWIVFPWFLDSHQYQHLCSQPLVVHWHALVTSLFVHLVEFLLLGEEHTPVPVGISLSETFVALSQGQPFKICLLKSITCI